MKKKAVITIGLIITAAIIIIIATMSKSANLNKVYKVEMNYDYCGKSVHTQLSEEDTERLCELCRGKCFFDTAIPSCGFGTAELVFYSKSGTTKLYPACDGCDTMRLGSSDNYTYSIGEENRAELEEILAKYGVTFPCV